MCDPTLKDNPLYVRANEGLQDWHGIDQALAVALGGTVFEAWFGNGKVRVGEIGGRSIILITKSRFIAKKIDQQFSAQLLAACHSKFPDVEHVDLRIERS